MRTHPLPPPSLACVIQDLKVVVLQRTVVSRFECFVFEVWVLRFRVLGAPFSRFGCFVFEIWVLRTSVFVFEYFVFETTFHFGHMHIRSLNNTSFIYVLVKVLTLIARFFPVNPFVDETDSSFEKKRSSCPSNIISAKANG